MNNTAEKLQQVIGDDLFPNVQNISDVKQVLEFMEGVAQPLREEQIRALIFLESLGSNTRLHGNKNPYAAIQKAIMGDYKKAVGETKVYIDTIESLIPKPPKPVVLAEKGQVKGGK